jgi:hypothetical protein
MNKTMLSVRVPEHLYTRLKAYCAANRLQVQEWLTETIEEKLDKDDPRGKAKFAPPPPPDSPETRMARLEAMMGQIAHKLGIADGSSDGPRSGPAGKPLR